MSVSNKTNYNKNKKILENNNNNNKNLSVVTHIQYFLPQFSVELFKKLT